MESRVALSQNQGKASAPFFYSQSSLGFSLRRDVLSIKFYVIVLLFKKRRQLITRTRHNSSRNFSLDQGLRRLADDFILAADLSYRYCSLILFTSFNYFLFSFLIPLLERLLSDRVATKKLCELHNFQTQLISIWIRCFLTFVLDGSSKNVATKTMLQNSLEDISDQILKIEQVRDVAEKQVKLIGT